MITGERATLAKTIAKQLEDATKGESSSEQSVAAEQFNILEIVAILLWPWLDARLTLKEFHKFSDDLNPSPPEK
jgi:hypothetical protein